MKRSAKPSTAGPNRLHEETGVSRKGTLSASLISAIVSQRWHSNTTRLDNERPKGLGGGFCGAQVQDCHASQVPE